jgi:hypothetical protein
MDLFGAIQGWWLGVGGGAVIAYAMKKIPNEPIKMFFLEMGNKIGMAITLGLSKWSWSSKMWNKTLEPYFVDLIDNTIGSFIKGLMNGLHSDN